MPIFGGHVPGHVPQTRRLPGSELATQLGWLGPSSTNRLPKSGQMSTPPVQPWAEERTSALEWVSEAAPGAARSIVVCPHPSWSLLPRCTPTCARERCRWQTRMTKGPTCISNNRLECPRNPGRLSRTGAVGRTPVWHRLWRRRWRLWNWARARVAPPPHRLLAVVAVAAWPWEASSLLHREQVTQ